MDSVLIVDDEPNVLAGLRRAIGRQFNVDTVTSADEAIRRLKTSGPYCAIVSDLAMADMDGITFLEHARLLSPATPRILLTGHGDRMALVEAINRASVCGFLQKPVPGKELLAALRKAVSNARIERDDASRSLTPRQHWIGKELACADYDKHFTLLFQPRICATSGTVVAAEALLRWNHPERGAISPGEFIPIAEATHQIDQPTVWVLRQAGRAWRSFLEAGVDIPISVNISPSTINTEWLVGTIGAALAEHGMPINRLEVEITENHRLQQVGQVRGALAALRSLGARTALDDFGTGYSSLENLRSLDVDMLKIDQSFVAGLTTTLKHHEIVRAITDLSYALGLTVIAEGVETHEQARILQGLGVHQLQGFLFSEALPPDRFLERCRMPNASARGCEDSPVTKRGA